MASHFYLEWKGTANKRHNLRDLSSKISSPICNPSIMQCPTHSYSNIFRAVFARPEEWAGPTTPMPIFAGIAFFPLANLAFSKNPPQKFIKMVFNFSEGYGPLFFANLTKFDPRVAYDPSILEAFNKWVIENRPKPMTTPPGGSPQKNYAPVHEVRHPIPVIGREIAPPPPHNYGNEPAPPGLEEEQDNDEGFLEQMDVDEDFIPPPPPPSPPHAVLLPIGHGRPQQRPQAQAPQHRYMPPLPQNQLPVGNVYWQHHMQNPQAQVPQLVPPFPLNRLPFPLHVPVQHQHPYMPNPGFAFPPPGHPHHPRAQLPIYIPLHGPVQHQHPHMPNHFFAFPPPGHPHHPRAHWNQPVQNQRFFPPQAADNELVRRLQQWRGPPIDPRRPRNQ